MFRGSQNNPMDEAVVKSTDENLTSENWEYILDVVDRVSASPSGPQQAVSSIIKRLAHRNANVQLYTLELANALSQNCGPSLHRELASKAFTDALLRLAADRNSHAQVKQKVLERMASWTEEFGKNPDYGIMEQAYQKLRREQPGLMPPSKPVKAEIGADDRKKEEDELQMALALSIKDKGASASAGAGAGGGQANGTSRDDSQPQPAQTLPGAQSQQGTTAATVSRVRALYDFTPSEPGELAFRKNDIIAVLESVYKDWWRGSLRGQSGIFPLNYVEKLQDPTKEELERDAQMEAEVFGEIKNVERLLALLSVRGEGGSGRRGEREEEEIGDLYQRTLSIRPKLIELIGKYSQKKDDFTQLNEKFIKARRDYEALLESSMSQPQYQQQQQFPIRQQRQPAPQVYPPQQQPPYAGQHPAAYPPQGAPPSAGTYPPQQQPYPQQDVQQRYYSPAPSEPPVPQPGYSSPYPQSNGPSALQPTAPFHFIPGGLQAAAPPPPQQEIRRKPSPQAPLSADAYGVVASQPFQAQGQGQMRPESIQTLNSGNPQELGTGGYESPVDNRHSYPPAGGGQIPQPQQPGYDGYAPPPPLQPQHPPPPPTQPLQHQQSLQSLPPQQQQQQMIRDDRETLPSRQRTHSLESAGSIYSAQVGSAGGVQGGGWDQQGPAPAPLQQQQTFSGAPPPGSPTGGQAPYQAYQAYQPQQQQRMASGSSVGGDPGDFYR